jgi:hypothetical protein
MSVSPRWIGLALKATPFPWIHADVPRKDTSEVALIRVAATVRNSPDRQLAVSKQILR